MKSANLRQRIVAFAYQRGEEHIIRRLANRIGYTEASIYQWIKDAELRGDKVAEDKVKDLLKAEFPADVDEIRVLFSVNGDQ